MIIDASVAFKWIFVEEGSEAAASIIDYGDLIAPNLLLVEIGNAMWKKGVRGELGEQADYAAKLAIVSSLVTIVDEADAIPRALEMAIAMDHPIHDCIYLAVAERLGDRLMTADKRFANKAQNRGLGGLVDLLA